MLPPLPVDDVGPKSDEPRSGRARAAVLRRSSARRRGGRLGLVALAIPSTRACPFRGSVFWAQGPVPAPSRLPPPACLCCASARSRRHASPRAARRSASPPCGSAAPMTLARAPFPRRASPSLLAAARLRGVRSGAAGAAGADAARCGASGGSFPRRLLPPPHRARPASRFASPPPVLPARPRRRSLRTSKRIHGPARDGRRRPGATLPRPAPARSSYRILATYSC